MFTRETTEPLTSLVKKLDQKIAENPDLKSFVVYLTDNDGEKEVVETLRKLASEHDINNIPLTLMDTPDGPRSYKLSGDAEVTVLLWRGTNVRANHAFGPGDLSEDDVDQILADLPKILDP
ncbi:hypothetical protein BH23PLA1_BH23PLA1_22350 [soil metagenome]